MSKNHPFRQRRPRWHLRFGGRNRPALQRLKLAHTLMQSEEFAQAAVIFEELGDGAVRRGIPRAPQLFLQAGRAQTKAGNTERGTELLLKGVRIMPQMGQLGRLPIVGRRILDGLRDMGLDQEYQILEDEINKLLSQMGLSLTSEIQKPSQAKLPPKCPYCGGTVHSGEVDWINDYSATCDFCGSVIEGST